MTVLSVYACEIVSWGYTWVVYRHSTGSAQIFHGAIGDHITYPIWVQFDKACKSFPSACISDWSANTKFNLLEFRENSVLYDLRFTILDAILKMFSIFRQNNYCV